MEIGMPLWGICRLPTTVFTVLIFVCMGVILGRQFISFASIYAMASQIPELVLYAMGISLAMMLGGIDLSCVGLGNMGGLVAIIVMQWLSPITGTLVATLVAIVIALGIGSLGGSLNGALISKLGVPAMLATLGTSQLFLGVVYICTGGSAVFGVTPEFAFIGGGKIFGIPFQTIIALLIVLYLMAIFQRQTLGKQIYLVGTNAKAATFSGINKDAVIIKTHMLVGIISTCAGLILCSRSNSVKADYGTEYTLQCMLIAVLGGVSPKGGFGKLGGVVLAAIALQMLQTGLNMLRVNSLQKAFVWGLLLILFMLVNYYSDQNANKKKIKLAQQAQAASAQTE